jgi:hypothetical protein
VLTTDTKCQNKVFFIWLVDLQTVLNRAWKLVLFQIMLFVYVCSTWDIVELKTRFETWITRNDLNGDSPFTLYFNNTYGLPVISMDTKCPNKLFYVWLVDLQKTCAKYGLETWFSPNVHIPKCLFDMKLGSTKNTFCVVNNKKWRKWCKFVSPFLFNNNYSLPVLTKETKCPNQVFTYDLSTNILC